MNLGKKIKQMRNQKGLTQEELADRCELTKGYISQLENNLNSTGSQKYCLCLEVIYPNFFKKNEKKRLSFLKTNLLKRIRRAFY